VKGFINRLLGRNAHTQQENSNAESATHPADEMAAASPPSEEERHATQTEPEATVTAPQEEASSPFQASSEAEAPSPAAAERPRAMGLSRGVSGLMPRSGGHNRKGVTLTEVLVTTAITVVLFAITLPAIMSARTAMHRTELLAEAKDETLALQNFHDTHGHYPHSEHTDKEGRRHTWAIDILPFREQGALYDIWEAAPPGTVPDEMKNSTIYSPYSNTPGGTDFSAVITGNLPYTDPAYINTNQTMRHTGRTIEPDPDGGSLFSGVLVPKISGVGPTRMRDIRGGTSHTVILAETTTQPKAFLDGFQIDRKFYANNPHFDDSAFPYATELGSSAVSLGRLGAGHDRDLLVKDQFRPGSLLYSDTFVVGLADGSAKVIKAGENETNYAKEVLRGYGDRNKAPGQGF
jgi:prepilin-type N-terminal cleavage/methylation domain-containing protein